jgi:hypothetical protein
MSATFDHTTLDHARPDHAALAIDVAGAPRRTPTRRGTWAISGIVAGAAAFAATLAGMPRSLSEEDYNVGVDVIDKLDRGGFHIAFVLGMVSVGALLVAAAGWRRWAEQHDHLAARTIGQALGATAAINVIGYALMGSMALYLPGGPDAGWLSREGQFANFNYLDFGVLFGWWGAFVAAVCVAVLALRRNRLLPLWMGVVSVVLCIPPLALGVAMPLPGFVGLTMPIWLVVISVGMVLRRR